MAFHNGGRTYGIVKGDRFAYPIRAYRIISMDTTDGAEYHHTIHATSVSEALQMAERADAGKADRVYGITSADYPQAQGEGITFNEADGLLID